MRLTRGKQRYRIPKDVVEIEAVYIIVHGVSYALWQASHPEGVDALEYERYRRPEYKGRHPDSIPLAFFYDKYRGQLVLTSKPQKAYKMTVHMLKRVAA